MPNLITIRSHSVFIFVLLSLISQISIAAEFAIGNKLRLGDNLLSTETKLKEYCQNITLLDTDSPRFPLATNSEQHLICDHYKNSEVTFGKAAFVIADDQFVHMEAIDVSVPALEKALGETNSRYLNMNIYDQDIYSYWLDDGIARFVWLHNDAKHPNLFSWHNPYLASSKFQPSPASIEMPTLLDFDSDLETLKPLFADQCQQTRQEHHEKVWLENNPKEQIQINCFGYLFAGFERKLEAVFGDGRLQLIWILTAKAEEHRLRELLVTSWGEPEINTAKWEVYAKGRISLRKDKPELLVLSDQMIPLYRNKFNSE